jgi:hypothetical protein
MEATKYIMRKGFGHWRKIAQAYTRRILTFSSDEPLAPLGIAEAFGNFLLGEYRAGLWQSSFHAVHLWETAKPHEKYPKISRRPTIY